MESVPVRGPQLCTRVADFGESSPPKARGVARRWTLAAALLSIALGGCKTISPSNFRTWSPDQNQLSWAEFQGDRVQIHNIRNCTYVTQDDYIVNLYDKAFDLNAVTGVDFVMVPFGDLPSVAHTMLSFEFDTGDHVVASVEIRKEDGESYNPVKGLFRQYEIMYVIADERDAIQLSAVYRDENVYVYRTKATREQARALFVDVLQRANKLIDEPEFYHTLTNNCTTNIRRHVNRLLPGRVPYGPGILLPGLSDRLAYQLGLIDTSRPFDEVKEEANVSPLAHRYKDSPDFSQLIRR